MLLRLQVPFFESITDDQYEILASLCTIERFAPGTVIFKEGDAGDTFYIVAHGMFRRTCVCVCEFVRIYACMYVCKYSRTHPLSSATSFWDSIRYARTFL